MDDYISRQAAIAIADAYGTEDAMDIRDELAALPSADVKPKWVPVKTRPMTEEERIYYAEHLPDYDISDLEMYDFLLPSEGEDILVCHKSGAIWVDRMDSDGDLEDHGDWGGIVAWMPMPEPYRGSEING